MNLRPPGYEPGELPDCSTPRCDLEIFCSSIILYVFSVNLFLHNYNKVFFQIIFPRTTLAASPAAVAQSAPGSVQRVFRTLTAIKYTDIV